MKTLGIRLWSVLLLFIVVSSCNRKGCTDENATNYSNKAKKDDGSCTYPTSVKIISVETKYFPVLDFSNQLWDNGTLADPYILIEDEAENELLRTSTYENTPPPIKWDISPALTINDFSKFLVLHLYDDDGGSTSNLIYDESIVIEAFYFGEYTAEGSGKGEKYPPSIQFNSNNALITLNLTWE